MRMLIKTSCKKVDQDSCSIMELHFLASYSHSFGLCAMFSGLKLKTEPKILLGL